MLDSSHVEDKLTEVQLAPSCAGSLRGCYGIGGRKPERPVAPRSVTKPVSLLIKRKFYSVPI
jgi:hypothetical protein